MGSRTRLLILIAALALAFVAIPTVVTAAGGAFVDDDDSVFETDIEWLASAQVTLGCNPPTNDRFCPDDNVSRGQMAAFMRRFAEFLGAEDGTVTMADTATYATDAGMLDGHDSTDFMGNDGYSVWNNGPTDIPTAYTTLLELPDLPAGSYLFIAKTWFHNGGTGEQFGSCQLVAGADSDTSVATLETNWGAPATWTVVHTFTAPTNSVQLNCMDGGFDVSLNQTKITGIRLDSITNQAG